MAQITITTLNDGPRNAAFHVAIIGNGTSELADEVVIDPATSFNPSLPSVAGLTLESLWYDLTGFDAWLEWDDLISDTLVWSMTGDQYAEVDLCDVAGLKDRSGPDGLGKLKISTSGLGNNERGVIVIRVRKD